MLKFLSNGDGAPPCEEQRRLQGTSEHVGRVRACARVSDLLHVAEDVLPAVEDSSALLAVQLVDEVGGEVLVAVLVPETQTALKVSVWLRRPPESFTWGQINAETSLGRRRFFRFSVNTAAFHHLRKSTQ